MELKNYGEFTCDKCHGLGYVNLKMEPISISTMGSQFKHYVPGIMEADQCDKCKGTGSIDWVTKMKTGIK